MAIRALSLADIEVVQDLEHRCDGMFADTQYGFVAALPIRSAENLRGYIDGGRSIAWSDENDVVLAFLLWDELDGALHIEQLSTDPRASRRGLGRQLVRRLIEQTPLPVTLCTFRDVAWNAPYYAGLGFVVLDENELTPGLRALRANEVGIGFDPATRCCMRRA